MSFLSRLTAQLGDFLDATPLAEPWRSELLAAERLLRAGDAPQALLALEAIEASMPGHWRTAFLLGLCHEATGDLVAARRWLTQALRQRDQVPILAALARVALAAGDRPAAIGWLDEALRRRATDAERLELLRDLADLHAASDDPARAVPTLLQAHRLAPLEHAWTARLVRALLADRAADQAVALLDHLPLPDHTPLPTDLLCLLGEALMQRRQDADIARAAVAFRQVLREAPDRADALEGLADALLAQHDHANALPSLLHALAVAPPESHARLHRRIGQVYLQAQQPLQALDALRAAVTLDPADVRAQQLLTRTALQAGSVDEALAATTEALAEHPHDRVLLALRARALLQLGDREAARALLTPLRAASMTTDEHAAFGALALLDGDPVEALLHLREANARDDATWGIDALLEQAWLALAPDLPPLGEPDSLGPERLVPFLDALSRAVASHPILVDLIARTTALRQHLDQPLTIAVLGEFNAGKSTLINAWVGEAMLATSVLPTTAHLHVIRYGPRRVARWTRPDGQVEELPFAQAARLVRERPEDVAHLEFCFPHPDLRSVHFWDTPGFNAPVASHDERAEDALRTADAVVWLLDAGQALSASEYERLQQLPNAAEKLLVVLNKIDRGLSTEDLQEIQTHILRHLGDRHVGLFPLSGLRALQAAALEGEERERALAACGWTPFMDALHRHFFDRAGRLKTLEVARELHGLCALAVERAEAALAGIRERNEQLRLLRRQLTRMELDWTAQGAPRIAESVDDELVRLRLRVTSEVIELRMPAPGLFGGRVVRAEDRQLCLQRLRDRLQLAHEEAARTAARRMDEADALILQASSGLATQIGPPESRTVLARLDAWLRETRALRRLLGEAHATRFAALDDARISALGAAAIDELANLGDDEGPARDAVLQRLVPLVGTSWRQALGNWSREYLQATLRLCDVWERDLDILALDLEHRIVRPFSKLVLWTQAFVPRGPVPALPASRDGHSDPNEELDT